jgi:predicted TIM-barrel fold metal-dependent hydrolase
MSAKIMRAYNTMVADVFAPFADRIIPVGVLSLASPDEALDQLNFAHGLGLKVLVTGGTIVRTIEADGDWQPDPAKRRLYIDALGLDSPYNYDPVWERMSTLGIPLVSHSGSMGWPDRSLPNNFVANHVGHFAQSHHTLARSLFLGGVTDRFPDLNVGFMEGGVGWACSLLADLLGHWEKRNKVFMAERLRPTNLDKDGFRELYERYTQDLRHYSGKIEEILQQNLDALESDISQEELASRDLGSDDFANLSVRSKDDVRRLFSENFYFGCEADDPMTAVAFDDRLGFNLKPVLGSDISHFDVVDATEVLHEAFELVEHGLITETQFKEFTFSNAVSLYQEMNPDFFNGTVIEAIVKSQSRG